MSVKSFIIRQVWRIKETYRYLMPLFGIVNTILYFVIAVGVTDLFDLTLLKLFFGIFAMFFIFNLIGFVLDKTNIFSKDYEKMFEGISMTSSGILADYTALKYAKYAKMEEEEINELLDNHIISKTLRARAN